MIKILFVLPYKELAQYARSFIEECNLHGIEFETEDIYGTEIAKMQETTADIIVARGMSASMFKTIRPDLCHVPISITSYDLLYAIKRLKEKYVFEKVALIWPDKIPVSLIEELLDIKIVQYEINDKISNISSILDKIETEKNTVVIGGLTIASNCRNRGIGYIPIVTTKETLEESLHTAIQIAHEMEIEQEKIKLTRALLDHSKTAMCLLDNDGIVIEMNSQFFRTFHVMSQGKGILIDDLIQVKGWWQNKRPEKRKDSVQNIQNLMVIVSLKPIEIDEKERMYVVSFEDAETIRSAEGKIRNKLRENGLIARYRFENILGHSPSMLDVIHNAYKYSQYDSNILILGESGTGKELFAQSIHNASQRSNKPFVAINCAAMPEQLLESEFFGYVEGSFTGSAKGGKAGLFEQAHKGTIFLDEIGELPVTLQAKLLRVLQEKEIRRIGDSKVIPIDVRVICATNINIEKMINENKFRLDLYYRINVFQIKIPALRERIDDIPELYDAFIRKKARYLGMHDIPETTEAALTLLKQYNWPGNIRELQNVCERLLAVCEGKTITPQIINSTFSWHSDLETSCDSFNTHSHTSENISDTTAKFVQANPDSSITKEQLEAILCKKESKTDIAKRLGISRSTLYRRLKELETSVNQ